MAQKIVMPKLGMTMTEGTITEWYKEVGDPVEKGEPILMISSEKLNQDVEAPASGVLLEKHGELDDLLQVGEVLALIGAAGEVPAAKEEEPIESVSVSVTEYEKPASDVGQPEEQGITKHQRQDRIFITPLARRMAEDKGMDIRSLQGTGGRGRITKRDVEQAMTDNAGDTAWQERPTGQSVVAPAAISAGTTESRPAAAMKAADKRAESVGTSAATSSIGEGLSPMRKAIAKNMRNSLSQTAQLTLHRKVEADRLIEFHQTLKGELASLKPDSKLSLTVLLARAVVLTLQEMKSLNATYQDGELKEFNEVHLGIATSLEAGLVVPVIQNAQQKTIGTLADEMKTAVEAARSGKADPSLLSGSTFTITNLGASGIEYFTPILNPPETGILGVGSVQEELTLTDDQQVKMVKKIPLSLTFDHQIVDGATAAEFLAVLARYMETPYLLVL